MRLHKFNLLIDFKNDIPYLEKMHVKNIKFEEMH